jgi:hypothetical protein
LSVLTTRPKVGSGCHSCQAITTGIWFTMRDGSCSSRQCADEVCGLRLKAALVFCPIPRAEAVLRI